MTTERPVEPEPEPQPWGPAAVKVGVVLAVLALGGIGVAMCRDQRDLDEPRKANTLPDTAGTGTPAGLTAAPAGAAAATKVKE